MTKKNNDKVGYGKPPKKTRFKKGKSGNPKGRPKKTEEKPWDVLEEELSRDITVKEGNISSKISMWRALIRQLVHKAVQGDHAAIKTLIKMKEKQKPVEFKSEIPQINLICETSQDIVDD